MLWLAISFHMIKFGHRLGYRTDDCLFRIVGLFITARYEAYLGDCEFGNARALSGVSSMASFHGFCRLSDRSVPAAGFA